MPEADIVFALPSFESFVFRYPAPSLTLISVRLTKPSGKPTPGLATGVPGQQLLFAFFTSDPWKMNSGNTARIPQKLSKSILAVLKPTLDVQFPSSLAPTMPGKSKPALEKHLLLSSTSGLGIGQSDNPTETAYRLWIDSTMQTGRYHFDPVLGGKQSYTAPTLDSTCPSGFSYHFEVLEITTWGLGGPSALESQRRAWTSEKREADRRKEVQIRKAGGGIDREILVMAGVLDDRVEGMGIERYKTDEEARREKEARELGHF